MAIKLFAFRPYRPSDEKQVRELFVRNSDHFFPPLEPDEIDELISNLAGKKTFGIVAIETGADEIAGFGAYRKTFEFAVGYT
ncbi:MAG: hypothetical protein Q7R47_03005 [Candidatus Diapherotrites archaeon]|nr:hypothetical protein [Candidatus Diapherotrites archaeon]